MHGKRARSLCWPYTICRAVRSDPDNPPLESDLGPRGTGRIVNLQPGGLHNVYPQANIHAAQREPADYVTRPAHAGHRSANCSPPISRGATNPATNTTELNMAGFREKPPHPLFPFPSPLSPFAATY